MFQNANALLRTLILAVAVLLAAWWTILLRNKLGERERELAERDDRIETLTEEANEKAREIDRLGLQIEERDQTIVQLGTELEEKEEEILALRASLELLKVDHRLARLDVLEQAPVPEAPDKVRTRLRFTELSPEGKPLEEGREMTVEGSLVYVETLVIKFGDAYVEDGDALRGTSVCLFRRLFGEDQKPSDGPTIDAAGTQPLAYGGDETPNPFYQGLWTRFWDYANDPELARRNGVRAIHGEAPFIEVRPGRTYTIELRASGGLTIRADD